MTATDSPRLSGRVRADGARPDWRDGKRYLWLIGAAVPGFLFAGWGLVNLTGLGVFWWIGPIMIYLVLPLLDLLIGADRDQPAGGRRRLARAGPLLPLGHLRVPAAAVRRDVHRLLADDPPRRAARSSTSSASRSPSARSTASRSTPRTNSATRRSTSSAGSPRSRSRRRRTGTSSSSTTGATTSASRHPRTPRRAGSASRSGRSCRARSAARCATGGRSSASACERMGKRTLSPRNDILNAWAMTVVLWAVLIAAVRRRHRAVPGDPGGVRVLPARGGQLPRALRAGAPAAAQRPVGAGDAPAQLEQQQRHDQPVPLPPAAAQRPPREPDPALPGAAALRRVAAAAQRVRHDDRAQLLPAAVAARDGQARARALRRRRDAGEHPARASARRCWRATDDRSGSDTLAA